MKKYRVEFNATGFYQGEGIWETLDEFCSVEANTAQEAIKSAIEYMADNEYNVIDNEVEYDDIVEKIEEYAWRASEPKYDENGYFDPIWEYLDD